MNKIRKCLLSVIIVFTIIANAYAQQVGQSAFPLIRQAAISGDLNAQMLLSDMYLNGHGIEKSYSDALIWSYIAQMNVKYDQSELMSDKIEALSSIDDINIATYNVARLLQSGNVLEKNPVEAIEWFRKGADNDFEASIFNLAMAYMDGNGIERDLDKAREYLLPLANKGNLNSQINMGISYIHNGIMYDTFEAYKWFTIAKMNGFDDKTGLLDASKKSLTEAQIKQAEKAAADWFEIKREN